MRIHDPAALLPKIHPHAFRPFFFETKFRWVPNYSPPAFRSLRVTPSKTRGLVAPPPRIFSDSMTPSTRLFSPSTEFHGNLTENTDSAFVSWDMLLCSQLGGVSPPTP